MSAALLAPPQAPAAAPPAALPAAASPPSAWSPPAPQPARRWAIWPDESTAVQQGTWFAGLSAVLQQDMLAHTQLRRLPAGAVLARRGSPAAGWFAVARGAVRLGSTLPDGRLFTLDFVGPGQWFGDAEVVDGQPAALDIVCHVPCTLMTMTAPHLRQLMAQHAELREALLRLNCQRLRHLVRRLEELQALPLMQRLAGQLLQLARRFGSEQTAGLAISLGISQADLAALVGGSRQRVNRAWRQMQQHGIVERTPSRLVLRDVARLQALAARQLVLAPVGDGAAEQDD